MIISVPVKITLRKLSTKISFTYFPFGGAVQVQPLQSQSYFHFAQRNSTFQHPSSTPLECETTTPHPPDANSHTPFLNT
jgi:hypothetical protein